MSKRPDTYRICLTPEAEHDLQDIWVYTSKKWSIDQANHYIDELVAKFELFANAPFIAHERTEFVPPVRVHRHQSHVIIYRLPGKDLDIVRVAHMQQNGASLLGE
jgi:toxin ParE1/3/4